MQVVPGLYIGGLGAALNLPFLEEAHVTHILNLAASPGCAGPTAISDTKVEGTPDKSSVCDGGRDRAAPTLAAPGARRTNATTRLKDASSCEARFAALVAWMLGHAMVARLLCLRILSEGERQAHPRPGPTAQSRRTPATIAETPRFSPRLMPVHPRSRRPR